jgi:hypothetical protein
LLGLARNDDGLFKAVHRLTEQITGNLIQAMQNPNFRVDPSYFRLNWVKDELALLETVSSR